MDVTADIATAKIICKKPSLPILPLELVYRDGDEKSNFLPGGTCFTAFVPKSLPMIFPPLDEDFEEY